MRAGLFIITLAGLALFWAGWSSVQKELVPGEIPEEVQLLVRPEKAAVYLGQSRLSAEEEAGTYHIPVEAPGLRVEREGWESPQRELESQVETGVRTFRCRPPAAKYNPRTKSGEEVQLTQLPDKEKLQRERGYYRLAPGPYEFLAEAEGHLPERVSLVLKPGQLLEEELSLKALTLPRYPRVSTPPSPPRPSTRPDPRPPTYRPRPAPSRPQPRFTPVATRPAPPPPDPQPMFTPLP